jgi:predicted Abi (CAAX) family protease
MESVFSTAGSKALLSLKTVPNWNQSLYVIGITIGSTGLAGFIAAGTGFIDPIKDFDPPSRRKNKCIGWLKPISAYVFPALVEEIIWRGILSPHPSITTVSTGVMWGWAMGVCMVHVCVHPVAGYTVWPRGKFVFTDYRFLLLATIALGGTTASYIVSGGSVWCAALTHWIPVALWRDFFGGEAKLLKKSSTAVIVETDDDNDINGDNNNDNNNGAIITPSIRINEETKINDSSGGTNNCNDKNDNNTTTPYICINEETKDK